MFFHRSDDDMNCGHTIWNKTIRSNLRRGLYQTYPKSMRYEHMNNVQEKTGMSPWLCRFNYLQPANVMPQYHNQHDHYVGTGSSEVCTSPSHCNEFGQHAVAR
eukprot:6457715-Amphidinium_carterae.1